ncbi:MAG: SDR family oxidoreductase [Myxococcota bacterium]
MSKIIVIGSNRGIGLELARQFASRGDEVIATCRQGSEALRTIPSIKVVTNVDIASRPSLDEFAAGVEANSIDVLVVVAGILAPGGLDDLNVEDIRRQLEVNAIGPLQSVAALRGTLGSGAKVALITSRMGSIADNTSGGSYGYRMSKAALNMAGRSLAHDLRTSGVAVTLLHPGFVRTDMTRGAGNIDADTSATGLIERIDALSMESSGRFLHQNGEELPW